MTDQRDQPADLAEAQLNGQACVRCGAEHQRMQPVEACAQQTPVAGRPFS
jgi:hypothetical protein